MKALLPVLLLSLFLSLEAQNLLSNPGFEEGLTSWGDLQGNVATDPQAWEGVASLRLENGDSQGRASLSQTLTLPPGRYLLSGHVRGEEIEEQEGRGARIILEGNQKWERITSAEGPETGTFPWRPFQGILDTQALNSTTIRLLPTLHGKGRVWYDALTLHPLPPLPQNHTFREALGEGVTHALFLPGGIMGLYTPGEEISPLLRLQGEGTVSLSVEVRDETGRTVTTREASGLPLPLQQTLSLGHDYPPGYYIAEATLKKEDTPCYRIQTAFIVNVPPQKNDPFYQLGYGVYGQFLEGFRRVGVGTISHKFFFADGYHIRTPQQLADYNLKVLQPFLDSGAFQMDIHVHTAPRKELRYDDQALADGKSVVTDEFQDKLKETVTLVAQATKGRIHTWSSGQEIPSTATIKFKYCGTWVEAMAQHLILSRIVRRAVRAVDPAIPFWTGGCNVQKNLEPYERLVLEDMREEFDGYLLDGYTGNWDLRMPDKVLLPEEQVKSFLTQASEMARKLGKPSVVRNNETGYAIAYGDAFDSPRALLQAQLTLRNIILNRFCRVLSFELFKPIELIWEAQEPAPQDRYMTTIWKPVKAGPKGEQTEGIPLPGGAMYATVARELAYVEPAGELLCGNQCAYLFQRQDGFTVATLWVLQGETTLAPALQESGRLVTMLGREAPYVPGDSLTLSPSPLYLVTSEPPQKVEEALREAFQQNIPSLRAAIQRHSQDQLALFLATFTQTPQYLTWETPGQPSKNLILPPGEPQRFLLPYATEGTLRTSEQTLTLRDQAPAPLFLPKLPATPTLDGTGTWRQGLPSRLLQYPQDIFPKEALQPERAYFKTDYNPDGHNISALCTLAYDAQCLYLAAEVDDPTHVQEGTGPQLWRGDSLQFAFSTQTLPPADFLPRSLTAFPSRSPEKNYGVALTSQGTEVVDYLAPTRGNLPFAAHASRRNGKTYYEVAIPWTELGTTPEGPLPLHMSLVIFDQNKTGDQEPPYWLALSPGLAGSEDASLFPLLLFP